MEIRRPTLKDKDAVLSMINEFLEQKKCYRWVMAF